MEDFKGRIVIPVVGSFPEIELQVEIKGTLVFKNPYTNEKGRRIDDDKDDRLRIYKTKL